METYLAWIHKDESDFGISFPDFPGCISLGATIAGAARSAQEALTAHIKAMRDDGEAIPRATRVAPIGDLAEGLVAVALVSAG